MSKWKVVSILAAAQFVMVLDSTVMNVSISAVVKDLGTTVTALQAAITFYTLTMAAFMLLGGKLGDIWGKRRAFQIGAVVYALGSLITALSPNITTLMIGWSLIEGLGAVLVIPAIAALVAVNYKGSDRVVAYAVIGGVSGAAAAAGPLIGGYVTTYLSWRYVFVAEVIVMAVVLMFSKQIVDSANRIKQKIDILSVFLSALGLLALVFGMLQSKTWGWVTPLAVPEIAGHPIAPFGISIVAYLIVLGLVVMKLFYDRQQKLEAEHKNPLLRVSMLSIKPLKSGLSVLLAQYIITAAVFFVIPVYLQMTLGYDALQTGLKIFPLSVALVAFSIIGMRAINRFSPKKIIRFGQSLLVLGSVLLLGSVSIELRSVFFWLGMFSVGAGLGLLASQIGNVNMSAVTDELSSEVGGVQGVAQNLGSSFGTALIGSIMVAALTAGFVTNVQASTLPAEIKSYIEENSTAGVAIVPVADVESYALSKGLSQDEASEITTAYTESQIAALRKSLFALVVISTLTIVFSKNIPDSILTKKNSTRQSKKSKPRDQ